MIKQLKNPTYLEMIAEFQREMQSTTSLNSKKEILGMYHDASIIQLALHYTYSPYKQFGLTSAQCKKRPDLCLPTKKDLFDILELLSNRDITGHDAIRIVNGFIMDNMEFMDLIFCIIDKDLKLRANTRTINKVIPNCIPTFDVALAEKYEPGMCDFITDSWYSSRKLDGVRCLIRKEGDTITAFSRQGKEFETLQNIIDEVAKFDGDFVLDGEVCMMDENGNEDFQGIMKQIRRKNHTIENPQFVIFDCLSKNEFDNKVGTRTLTERLEDVSIDFHHNTFKYLSLLEQIPVKDEEHMLKMAKDADDAGYEGIMLRKSTTYKGKRSKDILKVKTMHDAEYVVTGATNGDIRIVEEGVEKTINCLSQITIKHKGNIVGVGSGFTLDQRKEFGNDHSKILGKTITVQYFEESKNQDGDYSLRFPVIKHIFENGRSV
jgi:DNA ligase-1